MYEKFLELYRTKKWLFYILIVPFIFIFIFEMYKKIIAFNVKDIVKKAKTKDKALEKEQVKAEQGAKFHEEEANKIDKQIDKTKVGKDWHLQ